MSDIQVSDSISFGRARPRRRVPPRFLIVAAALLMGVSGGVWWLNRPEHRPAPVPPPKPATVVRNGTLLGWIAGAQGYEVRVIEGGIGPAPAYVPADAASARFPAFSADGSELVYQDARQGWLAVDVTTGEIRTLGFCPGLPGCGTVSPDGSRTALQQLHALVLRSGSNVAHVHLPVSATWQGPPVWSPDGRLLALALTSGIYVVDADGTNLRPVQRPVDAEEMLPAWSPDSERLAYVRRRPNAAGQMQYAVVVGDAIGTGPARVVAEAGHCTCRRAPLPAVVWSPDGNAIAYSWRGGTFGVGARGGAPRLLSRVRYVAMAWQPRLVETP